MNLIEWTSNYIKHQNIFKQNLLKMSITNNIVQCEYEEGKQLFVVFEKIDLSTFKKIETGIITVVCLNTKENLKIIIENWKILIKNPELKIIFVNPMINQYWSLIPFTHNKIADPQTLKLGLKTIFESVPEM